MLYGVPKSLAFLNLTGSTLSIPAQPYGSNLVPIFYVAAGSTARFQVFAQDPDGNIILGPGAPTFSAVADTGFTATATGDTIEIKPPKALIETFGNLAIDLASPACSVTGAVCTFGDTVAFDSVVAIGNTGSNAVVVFPQLAIAAGSGTPYATIRSGIAGPVADAFAASTGNLFVVNYSANTVTEYAPPYTGAPIATISNGLSQPGSIALALNGDLAVANGGSSTVEVYTPPYTAAPVQITQQANALAFDVSDNLWVANATANLVLEYTASSSYSSTNYVLDNNTNSINAPQSIQLDLAENLYVANTGELDEYGSSTNYSGPPTAKATGLSGVSGLSIDHQSEGSYLAACTGAGVNVYRANDVTLALLASTPAAAAFVPAFDRTDDLMAAFATLNSASAYAYQLGTTWGPGSTFKSALSNPVAIAEWP